MLLRCIAVLSTLSVLLNSADAYKILVVYPFPANSHNILGNGIVRHLLKAGHEITYITPFPLKNPPPKLEQIDVNSCKEAFNVSTVNIQNLMHNIVDFAKDSSVFEALFPLHRAVVSSDPVQKLLQDPSRRFDVVVAEYMFSDLYAGFGAAFDCPWLWILPYEPYVTVLNVIGGIPNPAYTPNSQSDATPPFTFVERVQELWSFMESVFVKEFIHSDIERKVFEEAFGPVFIKKNRPVPSFEDVKYNASMMLGNTDYATGTPQSYPASYKSIAGFFIEEDVKPLPEDLQKLMDSAKDGVIYFSLGSNLKSKELPDPIKRDLINMFAERKEVVIWKFEEEMKDLPPNVYIKAWAPQQSILAHPNCKLFITHGGLLSVTETVHFGVPFIGIPVYVDQFNNVNRMVRKGAALRVDLTYSLADDLRKAIKEITSNYIYTETAKKFSMIFHDRLVSPGTELVHWVEHVVRTGGAHHLRSPTLDLTWYQRLYLDLALVAVISVVLLKIVVVRLMSVFVTKKKASKSKKHN